MPQLDTSGRSAAATDDHLSHVVIDMSQLDTNGRNAAAGGIGSTGATLPAAAWTICPTVVVTKLAAATTDAAITFSVLPAAPSRDGRVGEYWYCAAVSSYFDGQQQYAAAKAVASRRRAEYMVLFLRRMLIAALSGAFMGLLVGVIMGVPRWGYLAIVPVCSIFNVMVEIFWIWAKNQNRLRYGAAS
uniref:Uncharacterized protein n=1 Tax=Oryza brachyantha TaxID=4533 RepID=J3L169_ORYBR